MIGQIAYEVNPLTESDSCGVFLSRIEICDQSAVGLEVTSSPLAWQTNEGPADSQSDFTLEQNYPNPFNPSTTITYSVGQASHVFLSVYDITGRQVGTLVDQYQSVGTYRVRWNADGVSGRRLASGVYIARLQVNGRVSAKTMNYTK